VENALPPAIPADIALTAMRITSSLIAHLSRRKILRVLLVLSVLTIAADAVPKPPKPPRPPKPNAALLLQQARKAQSALLQQAARPDRHPRATTPGRSPSSALPDSEIVPSPDVFPER
jgi:hypothetical protein